MDIFIRKAVKADAPALLVLNEAFNGSGSASLQRIEDCLANNKQEEVFVAQHNGRLIGFCCVQVFKSFCYDVDYAEITELYVDADFRRQGVGGMLLNRAQQYFRANGINNFQLFTGGENTSAQAFYEKLGFSKTDELMYRKRG